MVYCLVTALFWPWCIGCMLHEPPVFSVHVSVMCFAGLSVRELTGDMQLSKKELAETQVGLGRGREIGIVA